jgi:hypothetical protein
MEVTIPAEYKVFLAQRGAFEGFIAGDDSPGYVELWPLEAIEGNNRDVEISKYAPGFLAFAGNGGGEILAFDSTGAVYMLPLIGMAPDSALRVADCFTELAAKFELAA